MGRAQVTKRLARHILSSPPPPTGCSRTCSGCKREVEEEAIIAPKNIVPSPNWAAQVPLST